MECVDHVDRFFLWLTSLILPPSDVLLLGHCCLFGQVCLLWMTWGLQDAVLERELVLFILDLETDLSTVRIDDGFCGA